jgi:hypothetical protein
MGQAAGSGGVAQHERHLHRVPFLLKRQIQNVGNEEVAHRMTIRSCSASRRPFPGTWGRMSSSFFTTPPLHFDLQNSHQDFDEKTGSR